jgi:aerobic carbon-monoxide dehydrogenase medium subunit
VGLAAGAKPGANVIPPFELHRPSTLGEALELLGRLDNSAPYAGGTELLQVMKLGFARFDHLVDLKRLSELRGINELEDGWLEIGAASTHREIERSEIIGRRLPVLASLERQVANVRIRNVGTIGGNLCFAEPHSDPATMLVACGAELRLVSTDGHRDVVLGDFILDAFMTDRADAELLSSVRVPPLPAGTRLAYRRLSLAERPVASVACRVRVDNGSVVEASVVVGSVGMRPTPCAAAGKLVGLRSDEASEAVDEVAIECAEQVDAVAEGDVSSDYKRHLTGVLAKRGLAECLPEHAA